MKNILLALGLVLIAGFSTGCGHKTVLAADSATVGDVKSVNMQVGWVRNKKIAIDAQVKITNNATHAVFFKNKSIVIDFGDAKRGLKNTTQAFELAPGQSTDQIFIFEFGTTKAKSGVATLSVTPTNMDGGVEMTSLQIKLPIEAN